MRPDALFLPACLLSMPAIVKRWISSLVSFCEMSNGLRKLMLTPFFFIERKRILAESKIQIHRKICLVFGVLYTFNDRKYI